MKAPWALLCLALTACSNPPRIEERSARAAAPAPADEPTMMMAAARPAPAAAPSAPAAPAAPGARQATAVFAGGCFWSMEYAFEKVPGVLRAVSGYAGGRKDQPSYDEVSAGDTGHAESVQVTYDPAQISYERLLDVYWHNIDPTTPAAQFCDHGDEYRSVVFFQDAAQERLARESLKKLDASKQLPGPVVTQVAPLQRFFPAEEYHQDFYKKNPERYFSYRLGCGRDRRLRELWGAAAAVH